MRAGSIASVIAAILSTGGAFGGYMYFRPSDLNAYLEWKGHTLATFDEENLWKSIYEENKDNFNRDFGDVKGEEHDRWKFVREYCIKALKKKDYTSDINKSSTWCLDDVKTVRGQLVRNGKTLGDLMDKPEQFEVATAVQGNPAFWKLLDVDGKDFEEKSKAFEKWCIESLASEPKNNLVGNVDTFCRKKPYTNFEQKLEKDGYSKITQEQIKKKYTELKIDKLKQSDSSKLLSAIWLGSDKVVEEFDKHGPLIKLERFQNQYEFYCHQMRDFKVGREDYPSLFSEYIGICAMKKEEASKQ